MIRQVTQASSMVLILVVALYHPDIAAAHGTASGEDDPCLRQVGERVVHFSAYQPQYELKDQYCTDIPQDGDTFLVVDLVDPALRNEPVGMRVVKGTNEAEGEIVADIRPSTHPDGVLQGRSPAGRGPVYGHHCDGEAESDAAPAVSLAGTDDRLSEAGAHDGRPTARCATSGLARVQARTIEVAAELAYGKYTVKFRVLSLEGHVIQSSFDLQVAGKLQEK